VHGMLQDVYHHTVDITITIEFFVGYTRGCPAVDSVMVFVWVYITHGTQRALCRDNSIVNGPPYITVASLFVNKNIKPTRPTPGTKFNWLCKRIYNIMIHNYNMLFVRN
jgi:hypothetical protein